MLHDSCNYITDEDPCTISNASKKKFKRNIDIFSEFLCSAFSYPKNLQYIKQLKNGY